MERNKTLAMLFQVLLVAILLMGGCQSAKIFEGMWRIIYFKDRLVSVDRALDLNVIFVYTEPKVGGRFPSTFGDKNRLSNEIVDVVLFKKDSKDFVFFKTKGDSCIFNDTFQIMYINRDSFFIRSKALDVKCIRLASK